MRGLRVAVGCLAAVGTGAGVSTAALCQSSVQNYPSKVIRAVVPFAPGASTDLVARLMGQKLSEAWGQQIIGVPPEKWSSLMYGLWPDGGLKNAKEETHGRRDRHEVAAG